MAKQNVRITRADRRAELNRMRLFTGRDGDLHGLACDLGIDPTGLRKCDLVEYILNAELGR